MGRSLLSKDSLVVNGMASEIERNRWLWQNCTIFFWENIIEESHLLDPYMDCKNMTHVVIVTKMYFTFMFTLILDFLDELTYVKWMWSSFYTLENAFLIP